MVATSKGDANVAEQVEDLRERMRLLQGDRRANVDILEANKMANKDEIKRLREENKEVRVKLSAMQRGSHQHTSRVRPIVRSDHDRCLLFVSSLGTSAGKASESASLSLFF